MVMSWIFTFATALCCLCAALTGSGAALSASILQGAQAGITLAVSLSGAMCLWTGVGRLMEGAGLTGHLARLMGPILHRVFPSSKSDRALEASLSANICANFLGLGNAATPMGILAAKRLAVPAGNHTASDELCRLVVLNTASIQLIPSTVAALRGNLGSPRPFDILPAVWVTSLCSAGLGVTAAWVLGKLWPHD